MRLGTSPASASVMTAAVLLPMPASSVTVPAAARASISPSGSSATIAAALRKALTLLASASERSIRYTTRFRASSGVIAREARATCGDRASGRLP